MNLEKQECIALLESLIKTEQWHLDVANLLGLDWDQQGIHLIDWAWKFFYARYGEDGSILINTVVNQGFPVVCEEKEGQSRDVNNSIELFDTLEELYKRTKN